MCVAPKYCVCTRLLFNEAICTPFQITTRLSLNHNKTDFQEAVMIYRHAEGEKERESEREGEKKLNP